MFRPRVDITTKPQNHNLQTHSRSTPSKPRDLLLRDKTTTQGSTICLGNLKTSVKWAFRFSRPSRRGRSLTSRPSSSEHFIFFSYEMQHPVNPRRGRATDWKQVLHLLSHLSLGEAEKKERKSHERRTVKTIKVTKFQSWRISLLLIYGL